MNLVQNKSKDISIIKSLIMKINELAGSIKRTIRLMEVCGTHTQKIFYYGIRELLPSNIELLSGPGCPVCVTPIDYIDQGILLAEDSDVILTTYGDLLRVPGRLGSLLQSKAIGSRIEVIYSPLESLKLARDNPDKMIVFLGVGFETTIPMSVITLEQAIESGVTNFKLFSAHKLIPPALQRLTEGDLNIDGFILPGHVSVVIGLEPYKFLSEQSNLSGIITGFEPVDILYSICQLLMQIKIGKPEIINLYPRVVRDLGNMYALEKINKYFLPMESEWRGLGKIPNSGLQLRSEWADYDLVEPRGSSLQERLELVKSKYDKSTQQCICGMILTGQKTPFDCPAFADECEPNSPLGACMVSSEGTCAAYYRYWRKGESRCQ